MSVVRYPGIDGTQKCADADLGLMFADVNDRLSSEIKEICDGCRFLTSCREWGLHHERAGLWGGTDEKERKALRKSRRIVVTQPKVSLRDIREAS